MDIFESTLGVSLLCDHQGKVINLLCDELELASYIKEGKLFTAAFDNENREKAANFLVELKSKGVTFDWPLSLYANNRLLLLHFSGGLDGDNLFIVGNTTPLNVDQFFDELMKINNEQTNALRETMKAQFQVTQWAKSNQSTQLYEELSQLNNELAKKNRQLEQQRKELEQSEKMAALGRLVSNFAHASDLVNRVKRTTVIFGEKCYFNVHEIIQGTINRLSSDFQKTGITLQLDCATDLTVMSLPDALEQLLTHLLMNSLIYGFGEGRQAGQINILVRLQNEQLSLKYQDNGRGITIECLYICYDLVTEQLKGIINGDSQIRQGVTFEINYPVELSMLV